MKKPYIAPLNEQGFMLHMKDLKASYRAEYRKLRRYLKKCEASSLDEKGNQVRPDHPDVRLVKDAMSDLIFGVGWMHTGKQPGNKRGIERRAAYQKEKLLDPIRMQAFVSKSTTGSPANLTEFQRFQIEDALSRLSGQERECYELAHGACYPYREIAKLLGISKGTVQQYVERAQKKVSQDLESSLFLI